MCKDSSGLVFYHVSVMFVFHHDRTIRLSGDHLYTHTHRFHLKKAVGKISSTPSADELQTNAEREIDRDRDVDNKMKADKKHKLVPGTNPLCSLHYRVYVCVLVSSSVCAESSQALCLFSLWALSVCMCVCVHLCVFPPRRRVCVSVFHVESWGFTRLTSCQAFS